MEGENIAVVLIHTEIRERVLTDSSIFKNSIKISFDIYIYIILSPCPLKFISVTIPSCRPSEFLRWEQC